ncbi:MAG: response regulator transcription factor [Cyanobacteria bacterium]|nr:response regulator transcription factor [Cyanobacteriota bacterium]
MIRVLIVEDDLASSKLLSDFLTSEHYSVVATDNGSGAISLLENEQFDMAIIDWELPDISGVEIIKASRERGLQTKFLMLTGRQHALDKVEGLDSGADDYLTKPFEIAELSARVRALMRRPEDMKPTVIKYGVVTLDTVSHKVHIRGEEVKMLPTEYALLEFFLRYPNQVFSIAAILDRVWHSESDASESAVRTYITRLRNKLATNEEESPRIISVHGYGYKLVGTK